MSDRSLEAMKSLSSQEAENSLDDLSASKDLHKQRAELKEDLNDPANLSDLASASIHSQNVLRSSQGIEGTRSSKLLSAMRSRSTPHDHRITKSQSKQEQKSEKVGVFSNPAFKYSGNFISKMLSFLANILEVIKRFLLRLLAGPEKISPTPQSQTNKQNPKPDAELAKTKKAGKRERGR